MLWTYGFKFAFEIMNDFSQTKGHSFSYQCLQPAKIIVNGNLYRQCPRRLFNDDSDSVFLSQLYFECREANILPYPGSWSKQTAFTGELFLYLDDIVGKKRKKDIDKQNAEIEKMSKESQRDINNMRRKK